MRENQSSNKLRGQAFVVFREQEMADKALTDLRGFSLFGKPMVINSLDQMRQQEIQYARQQSDSTLKQKGAFDDIIRVNRRQKRKVKEGKLHIKFLAI